MEFNTVHRAKGTEADYVVVVDLADDRWGFPSQIDDDPLLELVLPPPHGKAYAFAEERRLFYVALTRARHGTYLITHPNFPSAFVLELLARPTACRRRPGAPCCPNEELRCAQPRCTACDKPANSPRRCRARAAPTAV